MMPTQKDKSPLLQAAIALMEARNAGMVTAEEWENLAKACRSRVRRKDRVAHGRRRWGAGKL